MYDNDSITLSGKISDNHYEQILIGIQKSPLVDNETKAIIPKPET